MTVAAREEGVHAERFGQTERLRLRPLGEADAPFILELLTSRGFVEGIGDRGVASLADARRYVAKGPAASHRDNGYGLDLVETRAEGEPVGICGLVRRPGLEGPDLGYAFLERVWGRGYAAEAGAETLRHAAQVLRLRRVWAVVKPANRASIAVLRRLAFAPVGPVVLGGIRSLLFAWTSRADLEAPRPAVVSPADI